MLPILKNHRYTLYEDGVPGLIYKKIKEDHQIFPKKHYSELTSPIVK